MPAPDVSIVIAAYNAEATLDRAIGSALAQKGVSVEAIVVDDCSSDQTQKVAEARGDDRVRFTRLPSNRGPGGARNVGLDLATGRWIAVLDADDEIRPGRLASMISRAEQQKAQVVVDNLQVVPEDGAAAYDMFPVRYLQDAGEFSLADFIEGNLVFESKFNLGYLKPIFERRFLLANALKYDETLSIGEDYLFLASALARGGKCVIEPEVGYIYHIREGSISRVLERRHLHAMREADRIFATEHDLDSRSRVAFSRRSRSLRKADSFLSLVQHIKTRSPLKALETALRDPVAVGHLRLPIAKRLRGAMARLTGNAGG